MYFLSVIFGLIQFILIAYILVEEVERKSPVVFMWATLFVMFAFPHLYTVIYEDMQYSTEIYMLASIFACGFCLLYLLFRRRKKLDFVTLKAGKRFEIEREDLERSLFEHLCFLLFAVALIGYVLTMIRAEGGLMNTSWGGSREIAYGYVSFSGLAERIFMMFSGLSLYYFLTSRKLQSAVVVIMFLGLILITRNRVQILPVMIFFVAVYLINVKSLKLKHIIAGTVMAVAAIYVIYAIRAFRYLGTLSNAMENFSWGYINSMVGKFISSSNGELGLRQFFYYFIEQKNHFEGFNRGYTYIRMLLVYIPSRWTFGLKPQSFDLYMGQAIGMIAGGSTHPTLFADCFGNLSWFGVLLGGFWAGVANTIDFLIEKQKHSFFKIMLYFLAAYAYVVIGRGSVYNGFEKFAWGALFLSFFGLLVSILGKDHTRLTYTSFGIRLRDVQKCAVDRAGTIPKDLQ